ncbi:MAG: hypothetical protein DRR42_25540 [Gammaproteobacteria bacterium]|nr:MAG: hypothetical protein DRR42_25540 [Gammaproteobacteria bacterium]
MTGNPIGIVICRVGAILLVVSAVRGLGFVITPLLSPSQELGEFFLMSTLMFLAPLVSAFLLAVYAEQISSTRFDTSRLASGDALGSTELVSIGTYLIGIYLLVFGVISIFNTEAVAYAQSNMFKDNEMIVESMSPHTIGGRISYVVQIALGLTLLVRGKKGLRQ